MVILVITNVVIQKFFYFQPVFIKQISFFPITGNLQVGSPCLVQQLHNIFRNPAFLFMCSTNFSMYFSSSVVRWLLYLLTSFLSSKQKERNKNQEQMGFGFYLFFLGRIFYPHLFYQNCETQPPLVVEEVKGKQELNA